MGGILMQTTTSSLLIWAASFAVGSLFSVSPVGAQKAGDQELFPPNAKPGECYARVFVPPAYKAETARVLRREASERIESSPAKYEWVEERVEVQGPSETVEVVPETYEWVEERVMVSPAASRTEVVPPVYETVKERVIDTPAHTEWKKGRGPLERIDHATGEIMCLVEVPATYKTVTKRVLKTPSATRVVEIPAKYQIVKKRVMKTPPQTKVVKVPAKYKTVKVQQLTTPAQTRSIPVPAEYQWVSKQVKVAEGKMAWRTVLCETNTTPQAVETLQRALEKAGYSPGKIDGVIGSKTRSALESYQRAKGLPVGGLTLDTLKSLGVEIKRS
jgi:hypothetical protein